MTIAPLTSGPASVSDDRKRQFLRRAMRCPRCAAPVEYGADGLRCAAGCALGARAYATVEGQPFLVDEAQSIVSWADSDALSRAAPDTRLQLRGGLARKIYKALTPRNRVAAENSAAFLALVNEQSAPVVLVVGAGTRGDGADPLWATSQATVIGFDIYASHNTDFVADAHAIPLADASVSGVWIQAVLEHVLDPQKVVSEIERVLAPGGVVYAETPFLQHVHEGAYDFSRFTHSGHRWLFRGFSEVASGPVGAAGAVTAWSFRYLARAVTGSNGMGRLAGVAAGWLAAFDAVGPRRKRLDAASGVFFLGRKSDQRLTPRDMISYYSDAGGGLVRTPPSQRVPDVTVVMTCYNEKAYIGEAVRSVLAQTALARIAQIIIVDDGSTDGSQDEIARIAALSPRIRPVLRENGGIAVARNAGLELVETPWCAILDGDDIWPADKIESQLECLDQLPDDVVLLYGDFVDFDSIPERGVRIRVRRYDPATRDVLRRYFLDDGPVVPSTCILRMSALRKVGLFNPRLRLFEDTDLFLRLAAGGGRFAHVDCVTYKRRRGGSLSSRIDAWEPSMRAQTDDIVARHPELAPLARRRMARRLAKIGEAYIVADRKPEGWRTLWRAVAGDPFQVRPWIYLGLSLAPTGFGAGLKRVLRRLRARRAAVESLNGDRA